MAMRPPGGVSCDGSGQARRSVEHLFYFSSLGRPVVLVKMPYGTSFVHSGTQNRHGFRDPHASQTSVMEMIAAIANSRIRRSGRLDRLPALGKDNVMAVNVVPLLTAHVMGRTTLTVHARVQVVRYDALGISPSRQVRADRSGMYSCTGRAWPGLGEGGDKPLPYGFGRVSTRIRCHTRGGHQLVRRCTIRRCTTRS
jgi:hypothetical protein